MQHGRKGFERLVWACKNVLNHVITWLFYDLNAQKVDTGASEISASPDDPLKQHHPLHQTTMLKTFVLKDVMVPPLTSPWASDSPFPPSAPPRRVPIQHNKVHFSTSLLETQEYFSLLSLASPRLSATAAIDPLLSRYTLPTEAEHAKTGDVVILRWDSGFLMSRWVRRVFVEMVKATRKEKGWMAMGAWPFEGTAKGMEGYLILQTEEEETEIRRDEDMGSSSSPTMAKGVAGETAESGGAERSSDVEESEDGSQMAMNVERVTERQKKSEQRGRAFVVWEYDKGGMGLGR